MATFPTGTTIAFATETDFTARIRSINLSETREEVNISDLSTSGYFEWLPADLKDIPPIDIECEWDPRTTATGVPGRPPVGAVRETVTLTFAAIATLTGTAFVKEYTVPIQIGEVMVATYQLRFDGGYNSGTKPTWATV